VAVFPKATFEISAAGGITSVCVGETLTLNAVSLDGGIEDNYDFQWKKNNGLDNIGLNQASFVISSALESDQDSYTVYAYRTDIACDGTSLPFPVTVFTKPVPSIGPIPALICVGTAVSLDGSGTTSDPDTTTPDLTFNWDYDDSNTGTGATPPAHTYSGAGSFDAKLTVSYEGLPDCAVDLIKPINVNPATAPTITAEPSITEICGDGSETVVLYVIGTYSSYAWTPTAPALDSLVATGPGTYAVTTTASNGCIGNVEFTLTPKPGCETATAGVPKVFTPNGDTFNDLWTISGVPDIGDCSVSIFDGRGRRILEVKGFPVTGWDGVANGKPVPDGTYYYVLGCPGSKPKTGSVLIVR
jgi:gliding motility-associated-like protein